MSRAVTAGDKIRVTRIGGDDNISRTQDQELVGAVGKVTMVGKSPGGPGRPDSMQIHADWNIPRSISLVVPPDDFEIIEKHKHPQ